jgi:hypothetical protein
MFFENFCNVLACGLQGCRSLLKNSCQAFTCICGTNLMSYTHTLADTP